MKKLMRFMYVALCGIILTAGFVSCGGGDDDFATNPTENNVGYEDNSNENYMPKLVGKWYFIETGKATDYEGTYNVVVLHLITLNSDNTWSLIKRHRLSKDNYVETIPGIDFDGTFTLESNNVVTTLSSGIKYVTWNFSTVALQQDIFRVVVKHDGSKDVENEEYKRFNYASVDACLNQYISQGGINQGGSSSGSNTGGNEGSSTGPQWGKVTGTIKAYGTSYSAVARTANGRTTTVDYVYYPSTGQYYVYGGAWDSSPNSNGGKGVRYNATKGYNSIRINGGAYYDSSTKTRYDWELYLQVTLP